MALEHVENGSGNAVTQLIAEDGPGRVFAVAPEGQRRLEMVTRDGLRAVEQRIYE
jgi:hypothetical protein